MYPDWVSATFSGFASASYTYTCNFSDGTSYPFNVSIKSNPQTVDNGKTCYTTQSGLQVWVSINGIASNKITR